MGELTALPRLPSWILGAEGIGEGMKREREAREEGTGKGSTI